LTYKNFEEKYESIFKKAFNDVYIENLNNYSEFYSNKFQAGYNYHPLFAQILAIHLVYKDKPVLEKIQNTDLIRNIDNAMSVYVFGYWSFNGNEENFTNL
jgi:hypothetical protein